MTQSRHESGATPAPHKTGIPSDSSVTYKATVPAQGGLGASDRDVPALLGHIQLKHREYECSQCHWSTKPAQGSCRAWGQSHCVFTQMMPVAINAAAHGPPALASTTQGTVQAQNNPIFSPKAWGDMAWGWGVLPLWLFVMAGSALSPIPGREGRKRFPNASDSAEGVVLQHAGCGRLLVRGK